MPISEALGEVPERAAERDVPGLHDRRQRQGEHGRRRIVERRLGDHGLSHLGPQPEPVEERDQDRRVGRGEHGPDQQCDVEADVEERRHDETDEHRREQHPGQHQEPEPDRRTRQHAQRDTGAAVEEDERDADGEDQLRAEARQRVLDEAERRGADERADRHQDDHLRHAQEHRDRPRAEACTEDEPEVAQDLLNVHRQRATLLSALPAPEGRGRAAIAPDR